MDNQSITPADIFAGLLRSRAPSAVTWVRGGTSAPVMNGLVKSYYTPYNDVLVEAEIFNLPSRNMPGVTGLCAVHIHQNGDCSGSFANTGERYNPISAVHPNYAGGMVPLPGNEGYAWTAFYDKHFKIEDILR